MINYESIVVTIVINCCKFILFLLFNVFDTMMFYAQREKSNLEVSYFINIIIV